MRPAAGGILMPMTAFASLRSELAAAVLGAAAGLALALAAAPFAGAAWAFARRGFEAALAAFMLC